MNDILKVIASIRSFMSDPYQSPEFNKRGIIFDLEYLLSEYINKTNDHQYDADYNYIKNLANYYYRLEEKYDKYKSEYVPD